jgi:hypothetical protein
MGKVRTYNPAVDEPTDYQAAVVACIEKIDGIPRQMREEQKEIDHLKAETQAMLTRLEAA